MTAWTLLLLIGIAPATLPTQSEDACTHAARFYTGNLTADTAYCTEEFSGKTLKFYRGTQVETSE